MKFEVSFKVDLTPEQRSVLDIWNIKYSLKAMGLEPEDFIIALKEKPDPLPAWEVKKYEPSLEELLNTLSMRHIEDIKKCFEACKSKSDIDKVIKAAPAYHGTFWPEYSEHSIVIVNSYFDDEEGDIEEEYWYDYPEDWEDDNED